MSLPERSRGQRLVTAALWLLVLALLVRAGVARASALGSANHDVGWFLHAGETWLDGGAIGVDVIDTNPPLVIWLYGGEVALARLLELAPLVVHAWVTSLLAVLGMWLATRALARSGAVPEVHSAFGLVLVALAARAADYEFGQREHWLVFLLLPYAALALAPGRGGLLRVVAGAGLALGVALKPHFLLTVLLVEGLRWFELRSLRALVRAELVVAALAAVLYVVAIQLGAPSYWKDARDTLAVYAAYDCDVPILSAHTGIVLVALVASGLAAGTGRRSRVPAVFALMALASALVAHLQRKNFAYHHIPTEVFADAALVSVVIGFVGARLASVRALLVLELAGAAVAVFALVVWPVATRQVELRAAESAVLARLAPEKGFLVFTSSVGETFPASNFAPGRSVSPYSCLWPIAGNYSWQQRFAAEFPYRTREEMPEVERRALQRVVTVLREQRPQILVFNVCDVKQAFGRSPFEFRRYFEAHPDFVRLMDQYELLSRDAFFEYYERRE